MSGFASRSALIGSSFLVLALASPSFADEGSRLGQGPGAGQAKVHMVHLRGEGRRGMLPIARLVCGDTADADLAAFQANLASGLNLTAEQQDLVSQIIAAVTADEQQVARMCERMDRMAERGGEGRKWGRHGWGERPERGEGMHGYGDDDDGEEADDDDEGEEQGYMQRPGKPGSGMPGHGKLGFGKPGHHGDHAKKGRGWGHEQGEHEGRKGPKGPMAMERLLNNPALSDEDRAALEGIFEKLKTAAQAKQKARHELRGLMMEFRHSLSKEQTDLLRKGGFQQFLPEAPKA